MEDSTIKKIIEINNTFYQHVAEDFDKTRKYYWKGWERTLKYIQNQFDFEEFSMLDLGCGNGRYLEFLVDKNIPPSKYIGLDSSEYLLNVAKKKFDHKDFIFEQFDLLDNHYFSNIAVDMVVSFGFMHHIPSHKLRMDFINHYLSQMKRDGLMILTFWSRFNRQGIKKYEELSNNAKEVFQDFEKNDYFFGWDQTVGIERYCHLFDDDEVDFISEELKHIKVIDKLRSDGKSTPDNIYLVLKKTD